MHNAGELAALIAAVFFAAGVCAGIYVLARLARLISAGTRLLADMRSRSDSAFDQVQAAVDRAHQQLDATSTVTEGMGELNAGMAELSEQVTALAGLGRAIASGPAGRVGAFVYGVRHAVAIRRDGTARPGRAVPPAWLASSFRFFMKMPLNSGASSPQSPGSHGSRKMPCGLSAWLSMTASAIRSAVARGARLPVIWASATSPPMSTPWL